ncbi:Glyoxalase_2 domain-containing protein [Cephalotus follicularis]|uniref:Glyoxalase_2 domain-containing protein n=1 Tax=Cephalotus follicularis TaxID=3775 RepID=A0A1Q3BRY6_CEPFO|nr:Glyoxalase_2 domain-containing protein [Cephalotus follicularis]
MAQPKVQNGGTEKAMTEAVKFTALKPQLTVEAPKAVDAVQFYKTAFGAVLTGRTTHPKRKAEQELPLILSAQLELAGTTILVSDIADDSAAPAKTGGTGVVLCLETEDVEAAIANAIKAGAVAEGDVAEGEDACGGGRVGKVKDPYGFVWEISSPAKNCADVEA